MAAQHARTGAPVIVGSMSPWLELDYYASLGLVYYSGDGVILDVDGGAGRVYVLRRPDGTMVRDILGQSLGDRATLSRSTPARVPSAPR